MLKEPSLELFQALNTRALTGFVVTTFTVFLFLSSPAAIAQSEPSGWTHLSQPPASAIIAARWVEPRHGELFQLNHAAIQKKFSAINPAEPADARRVGTEIKIPMPDGTTARFSVVQAPIMAPELAAKFPEIRTCAGVGLDDPAATVRLDLTPAGFHAQILSPHGAVYVDPAYRGDTNDYVSYFKKDLAKGGDDFQCFTQDEPAQAAPSPAAQLNKVQSGGTLRTFRLAMACTGEYTAYFGGTVSGAMSAIVTAVNRVDGIYETELAVRLVLVANNDLLVFTNADTDPYTNGDINQMPGQNQSTLDSIIGSANYDIGHVFSTGGGGVGRLYSVCSGSTKAQGMTGMPAPVGDGFYVDYVCHEMGHQFGALHTFNSTANGCGNHNRSNASAFEPGSGSTIMSYAGLCYPDNLQIHSDPYFHAASLDQIQSFVGGASCSVNTATGNSAPSVSAGTNYTIPASTPFVLTATGSDPNGDLVTYCWEEMDLGPATALTDPDNGSSPLFRSFQPTNSPVRYFPSLSLVLANASSVQEIIPTTNRTMTFRVTARDNRAGGGGVADSEMQVTVTNTGSPFAVTFPNTAVTLFGATNVTWNVAGTAVAPIKATNVDIYLSTDGGLTYPFLLKTNAPNTGTATVTLPQITTSNARIKIQGHNNVFYDVSDGDFSVIPVGPRLQITSTTLTSESCTPANGRIDPFETVTVNWAINNFGNAPTTNLVATLLPQNGIYYPGAPQNYGAIPVNGTVTRSFSFIPSAPCGGSVASVIQLQDGATNLGMLTNILSIGTHVTVISTQVFANLAPINDLTNGPGNPYPSTIVVSGVTNPIVNVTATITGLSCTYDVCAGLLLVGPGGQNAVLMNNAGHVGGLSNVNLTFDDNSTNPVPSVFNNDWRDITSGTYRPTNYYEGLSFPSPAPPRYYGTSISSLAGSPNGTWLLYDCNFCADQTGGISGGWNLAFTTTAQVPVCCATVPAPTIASTIYSNKIVSLTWTALPGPYYQLQYRTNLNSGSWSNLGPSILGTNTTMSFTDIVTNSPVRFYRVVTTP